MSKVIVGSAERTSLQSINRRLIARREAAQLTGVGSSTFDRYRAAGMIGPQPLRLGGCLRWDRHEFECWLSQRDADGELYDARTWSQVWAQINKSKFK